MKKILNEFWSSGANVNFHKLLLPVKIIAFLLLCGPSVTAISYAANNLKDSDFSLKGVGNDLQQQITVTGTITDLSTGEKMAGVNVIIKGTNVGAISDA